MKVKVGIIGSSGLENPDIFTKRQEKSVTTPFGDPSDVLILGEIDGVDCVLLARHGRKHDIMPGKVNYRANIWALKQEACTHIIASTATGSLQEHIRPGDIVIINSFIDRTQGRKQTFHDGETNHPYGVCHIPMEPSFCERTRNLIIKTAHKKNIKVHKTATIVATEGPRFSSKAESNMLRMWGGDVINMTSVPEMILAKEAGICYVQVALVTDYGCWREIGERACIASILKVLEENVSKITTLILSTIPRIAEENWDQTIQELQAVVKGSIQTK